MRLEPCDLLGNGKRFLSNLGEFVYHEEGDFLWNYLVDLNRFFRLYRWELQGMFVTTICGL